jgi:predicted phage tail protein
MTIINLHGILAREFGKEFTMHIEKPKQAIEAIDANKPLFKKRILELSQQGIHYSILVDGENIAHPEQLEIKKAITVVDLTPVICGQGFTALITTIAGALTTAGGTAAVVGGALATASTVAGVTTFAATALTSFIGGALNMIAVTLIQQALAPSQKPQRTEARISGAKESFLISSKGNLAEQGVPVPVGYGRLRIGTSIVQSTVKSYPQRQKVSNALFGKKIPTDIDLALQEQNIITETQTET